jgi:ribosomal protein S28E/S33
MPASEDDVAAVRDLVGDATQVLVWASSTQSSLIEDSGERVPVIPPQLLAAYQAAVEQAVVEAFQLAFETLVGANPNFTMADVLDTIERAGWTGSLRDFKLQVLEHRGRSEVTAVTRQAAPGGGIGRRIFRSFLGALNSALDSLSGVPGIAVIKELKDFLEGASDA